MFKRILTAIILVAALAASALFTYLNPGEVALDLGFAAVSSPLGLAFVLALAVGWVLGIVSALAWIGRLAADRRRLKAEVRRLSGGPGPVANERG